MTTKEFINQLQRLGYKTVQNDSPWITILNERNAIVAEIRIDRLFAINSDYFAFTDDLNDEDRTNLIELIEVYIKTPIEER